MGQNNVKFDTLLASGNHFMALEFPSNIPNSPNALSMYKWYLKEVEFVDQQLDCLEQKCDTQNVCKRGCSGCCRQLIATSDAEMLAMKIPIQNLSGEEKSKLKGKTNEVCSILSKNGFTPNSPQKAQSESARYTLQEKYFKLNLPCPLLNENNECSFYAVRPCSCWFYRCYGDSNICQNNWDYPDSIHYDLPSGMVLRRLFTAKRPKRHGVLLLPFALQELL